MTFLALTGLLPWEKELPYCEEALGRGEMGKKPDPPTVTSESFKAGSHTPIEPPDEITISADMEN